jgi:hypothetical protein
LGLTGTKVFVLWRKLRFVGGDRHPFAVERELPRNLDELATRQRGIMTRAQLLQASISSDLIKSRLRLGSWQRVYPGVYATFSGELSREAQVWAAVLYAGPGALASHRTAAELAGLVDEPSSMVHVTVPANRRVQKQPGIVFHLSKKASKAAHPSRLPPQTRIEETVLDLWDATRDLDAAVGWVTRAFGRRLTTQGQLLRALSSRHRIRWRAQLAQLLNPDSAGIHSVLEYRYVRDVERPHRFPAATRQAPSRLGGRSLYRDTLYEAYKTAVELDGRVAHPGDSRWNDIHRDNAAATAGISTLRYGWLEVTTTPCEVAAQIAAALAERGYTLARPCSPACPVGRGPACAGPPSPAGRGQHAALRRRAPTRAGRQPARAARARPKARTPKSRAGQT